MSARGSDGLVTLLFGAVAAVGVSGCCTLCPNCSQCKDHIPDTTECFGSRVSQASPPACTQPDHEPNDTVPMASPMTATTCGAEPVTGALAGQDVDFFHAASSLCDDGMPHLEVDADNLHACLFVQCGTGSTRFDGCSDGSLVIHHPSGLLGCCLSSKGAVDLSVGCGGDDHSVDVFVSVDGAPAACTPYTVKYHL